ncbi:MAG: 3'-5' exonuclease [Cyanobacteria bacterium P01_D01_bin.36]
MKVLIVDLETTGFDPVSSKAIEIGAILFDCATHTVLEQISSLIPCNSNKAQNVNQIAPEASMQSIVYLGAITHLEEMAAIADYITAWNSSFDSKWFGHPNQELPALDKPWFDAMGVNYARSSNSKKLIDVALAHGIPVISAHRALTDCSLVAELFRRHRNIEQLILDAIAREGEPKVLVIAEIAYEDRQKAKDKQFTWNKLISNQWAKWVRASEIDSLGFPVHIVDDGGQANAA